MRSCRGSDRGSKGRYGSKSSRSKRGRSNQSRCGSRHSSGKWQTTGIDGQRRTRGR